MELKVPMRSEMIFRIGSMTKPFAAVAILQLVEQEKISSGTVYSNLLEHFATKNTRSPLRKCLQTIPYSELLKAVY
jgi:CubicO group peptidase (beta-lactamase class C family)